MKKILSLLCVLVLTFMLTACGSSIVGKYTAIEMVSNGKTVTADDLKNYGMTIELEVKDDKTAHLSMLGEEIDLTYDDKVFTGKDDETGESKGIPYTLNGNKLTLEIEGEKIVFKK